MSKHISYTAEQYIVYFLFKSFMLKCGSYVIFSFCAFFRVDVSEWITFEWQIKHCHVLLKTLSLYRCKVDDWILFPVNLYMKLYSTASARKYKSIKNARLRTHIHMDTRWHAAVTLRYAAGTDAPMQSLTLNTIPLPIVGFRTQFDNYALNGMNVHTDECLLVKIHFP